MQISVATLLVSQQTAQAPKVAGAGFAAALQKTQSFAPSEFSAAPQAPTAQAKSPQTDIAQNGPARPGALIDIKV